MGDDTTLHFKLGEISGKLDALISTQTDIRKDVDDLSVRIGRLERLYAIVMAGGAAVMGLASIFGDTIRAKLGF